MKFDNAVDNLRKKLPPFLFYIKSDVSSESRFESDKEVLFSPKERYIENFGWGPSNFKEVMAFFNGIIGRLSPKDFEGTYRRVFGSTRNMVRNFAEKGIINLPFYALYDINLKSNIRFPVLLVNITKIWKKFCQDCPYNWETEELKESEYHNLMMKKIENQFASRRDLWEILKSKFNCLRTVCKEFCENPECKLTFIQNEHLYIEDKVECVYNLFNPIFGCDINPVEIHALGEYVEPKPILSSIYAIKKHRRFKTRVCIERPLRFAFEKVCYLMMDPKKWHKIANKETWLTKLDNICAADGLDKDNLEGAISLYGKMKQANYGVVPSSLLFSRVADEDRVLVSAPTRSREMLTIFMDLVGISSIIPERTEPHDCKCGLTHQLYAVPIHTLWKDSDVYRQEAGMLDLLWNKLWEYYGNDYCQLEFAGKKERKRIGSSLILRRNFKVSNIDDTSRYADCDYDYMVDLTPFGIKRRIAFGLTTALWRKGGIREEAKSPEEYFSQWRELLWDIPNKTKDLVAVWYIAVRQTESKVFKEGAPHGCKNIQDLVTKLTKNNAELVTIVNESTINVKDKKLIVIPSFRAYRELETISPQVNRHRLPGEKEYDNLKITRVIEELFKN